MKKPINTQQRKTEKKLTPYNKYLQTNAWKKTCKWFYENVYEKRCYVCGRKSGEDKCTIQLHHTPEAYNYLGKETEHPELMIPLCSICHRAIHQKPSNFKRFSKNDNV